MQQWPTWETRNYESRPADGGGASGGGRREVPGGATPVRNKKKRKPSSKVYDRPREKFVHTSSQKGDVATRHAPRRVAQTSKFGHDYLGNQKTVR